jgi:hypothetical protein
VQIRMRKALTFASLGVALALALPSLTYAQDAKAAYPSMAPLEQYTMPRDAEIALARSAAPESISRDAEVMALGPHGYEVAANGTNGFVCMVLRSWAAGTDEPDFWNPKIRAAICVNRAAARSYVPVNVKRTELILAGRSKTEMVADLKLNFDKKELSTPAPGAMCYMMSKDSYLSDRVVHWHPHLMFFVPQTDAAAWGANADGSPLLAADDPENRQTIFLIPVGEWSDGTPGPPLGKH